MSVSQAIPTPFGALQVKAEAIESDGTRIEFSVSMVTPQIHLPPGMEVDSVLAAIVHERIERELTDFYFVCRWSEIAIPGSPATGECLDAQEWESESHVVTIGTEDFQALLARLPNLGLAEDDLPVRFTPCGLEIHIPRVPIGTVLSLHFVVVARGLPDPAECSTWFAVDIPHQKLLAAQKS